MIQAVWDPAVRRPRAAGRDVPVPVYPCCPLPQQAGQIRLEVTNGNNACQPVHAKPRTVADLRPRIELLEGGPLNTATVKNPLTPAQAVAEERACLAARIAADNKARDVVVLNMREVTPLYDYFILATGISRRQIHTLAEEIDAGLRAEGEDRLGIEGYEASRWVVQDYGDIVVHLFDPDARLYYALEDLWADAPRVDWDTR
jgi:ribosome-associated protein